MIIEGKNYFLLNTKNTSYIFRVTDTGHLEHLYYGKRIRVVDSLDGLLERQEFIPGNSIAYDDEHPHMTLNNMCLEVSFVGKGDTREAFIVIANADGSYTSDFQFETAEIDNEKHALHTLPSSYAGDEVVDHLQITLHDKQNMIRLFLDYYVFEEEDV